MIEGEKRNNKTVMSRNAKRKEEELKKKLICVKMNAIQIYLNCWHLFF
jgi:hypothetical protein